VTGVPAEYGSALCAHVSGTRAARQMPGGDDLDRDRAVAATPPSAVLRAPDRDAVFDGLVGDLRVAAWSLPC